MGLFERKSPTPENLISAAADDFRRADGECTKLHAEIQKVRFTPPSLSDCMDIMREVVRAGAEDFTKLADERLKTIFSAEFDKRYLYDLQLTIHQGNGAMINGAVFALLGDEFLAFAESRLRSLGAGDSKLTFSAKAKKLAELEAKFAELSGIRDEALTVWRRLSGNKGGAPE